MPKVRTEYNDFRGGWIVDQAPDLMQPNALMVADNIDLSDNGAAKERAGTTRINATSYGANVTQLIRWPRDDGSLIRLAVVGGNLCRQADDGTLTVIRSVASDKIGYYIHQDVFYFVDGNDYYWYNGTVCREVQQPGPSTPTMQDAVANPFTHTYYCFYVVFGGDGIPLGKSATLTVNIGDAIYSSLEWDVPRYQTSYQTSNYFYAIGLYRTTMDGSIFKQVAYFPEFAGPEGQLQRPLTYIDAKTDAQLGDIAPNTNDAYDYPSVNPYNYAGTVTYSGTYQFLITALDELGHESKTSDKVTITVNNSGILWSYIPPGPTGTTARKLYRTTANGSVFYLVNEINDNTTTSFLDTIPDGDLTRSDSSYTTLITDNYIDQIKKCRFLVRHPQSYRIFANGDGTPNTYYSEPSRPEYFKKTNIVIPTTGDGPAAGLKVFMNAIVIGFHESNWVWQGIDPETDATWSKLATPEGTVAPWTMQLTPNSMTYLAESGPVAISAAVLGAPTSIAVGDQAIRNLASQRISSVFTGLNNKEDAVAIYNATKQTYLLAVDGVLYAFFWQHNSFSRWTGIVANDILYDPDGEVWIATTNYILKLDPTVQHDTKTDGTTTAITYNFQTPALSLNAPFNEKRFERIYIAYEDPLVTGYSYNVKVYVDDTEVLNQTYTPPSNDAGRLRQAIIEVYWYGRRISIAVSNNQINTKTVIYGIALDCEIVKNAYGSEV